MSELLWFDKFFRKSLKIAIEIEKIPTFLILIDPPPGMKMYHNYCDLTSFFAKAKFLKLHAKMVKCCHLTLFFCNWTQKKSDLNDFAYFWSTQCQTRYEMSLPTYCFIIIEAWNDFIISLMGLSINCNSILKLEESSDYNYIYLCKL